MQMLAKKVDTLTKAMEVEAKRMRREVASMEKEVSAMRLEKEQDNRAKRFANVAANSRGPSLPSSQILPGRYALALSNKIWNLVLNKMSFNLFFLSFCLVSFYGRVLFF